MDVLLFVLSTEASQVIGQLTRDNGYDTIDFRHTEVWELILLFSIILMRY